MTKVLTYIDLVGIQRFIFSSNRLRDIAGASLLVNNAVSGEKAIAECGGDGALIVGGGGNAVLEFDDSDNEARDFAARYSRWLIENAGLDAVVCHQEFKEGGIPGALRSLFDRVAPRAKSQRAPSTPLLGIGVTAACRSTGLPAEAIDRAQNVPVARTVRLVRDAAEKSSAFWARRFLQGKTVGGLELAFPMELDDLGRSSGESSLIAIVHIDGNSVGRHIRDWMTSLEQARAPDDQVKSEYAEWSRRVQQLGEGVMRAVVDRVIGSIVPSDKFMMIGEPTRRSFPLRSIGSIFLPLRPVILGGDDITFLCDGRVALDLAATALEYFENADPIPHLGRLGASAGVAIIPAHAPVLRGWDLAEQLCRSAKQAAKNSGKEVEFAIDWHIGLPRPGQSLHDLRREQYEIPTTHLKLTSRPCLLGGSETAESWRWIDQALLGSGKTSLRGEIWGNRRNKAKQLRELARDGTKEIETSLNAWRVVEPDLAFPAELMKPNQIGFIGNRTPLLDAVELMDLHLDLSHSSGKLRSDELKEVTK
jgi:hypothetical protein